MTERQASAKLSQALEIELCSHVCPRCGFCDRCCDGHEDSHESEQR